MVREDLNKILSEAGVTPTRRSDKQKPSLMRGKFVKLKTNVGKMFTKVAGQSVSPQSKKSKCGYCDTLLHELAEKFKKQETREEKFKVLTCIPKRFTIDDVYHHTGCSYNMAKDANKLKSRQGAFSVPPPKHGKPLDANIVDAVKRFYQSEDHTRPSPRMHDVVRFRDETGQSKTAPKLMLMVNLKDLYYSFKQKHPEMKISKSKFAKLRPRNCIWPGIRGFHVTCCCEMHQNFEFLLEAIECELKVKDFLSSLVCPRNDGEDLREECYLSMCSHCPKLSVVDGVLKRALENEAVMFSQWTKTDQKDIQLMTYGAAEFDKYFREYIPKILEHEYVTEKQKAFLRNLKNQTLKEIPAVTVQLDFAQNYSFVIQNDVQVCYQSYKCIETQLNLI